MTLLDRINELANKEKVHFIEYEDAIHNFVLMKHRKGNVHAKDGYEKVVEIINEGKVEE